MTFPCSVSLMRHVSLLGCIAFAAANLANAQSTTTQDSSSQPTSYSSSQEGLSDSGLQLAEFALPSAPNPANAASAGGGAGQYGNGGGYGGENHKLLHHWTFEAGGGFNAPIGNDTPYITWGGNFTVGGGLRLSDRLSVLAEYQFMDNKLPGALIAAVNSGCSDCGVTGGNAHINAITGSPVYDLTPKRSNGIYVVGGFGYYHKSTNFQSPEEAFSPYYGYYYENVTVASFTSNQWGGNAGLGIYHRIGSMFGSDSHTQVFAEARYTFIHTPPITADNGLGTTELIPVTIGLRF
jgi:Outer membrane protein beta-barrel domain